MEIKPLLDYETILANTHQPIHFALQLGANEIDSKREQPLDFCVVLDRSASMGGEPLNQAKAAAILAVRNLRKHDRFALIIFNQEAHTLFPLQKVTDKAELTRQIQSIRAGGGTNLTGGWMLGRDALKQGSSSTTRRLLLLSDGQLNQGITDTDQVLGIIFSGLKNDQIRTSSLGFGEHYDEDLLSELANRTNGQFYDANSADKLPPIFEAELDGLQRISAQNIRVRLKPLDFCDNLQPLGTQPSVTLPDGRMEYSLGDLVSGEEQVVCWSMDGLPMPCVDGQPVTSLEGEGLLDVEVVYDEIREEGIGSETFHQIIRIKATQDPAEVTPNGQVVSWTSIQRSGKTISEATKLMDKYDVEGALNLLNTSIERLQALENVDDLKDAINPLALLRDNIRDGRYDAGTRKRAYFKSRNALYMKSKSLWTLDDPMPNYIERSISGEKNTDKQ